MRIKRNQNEIQSLFGRQGKVRNMDVSKSLDKIEAGINEAKSRFMDGLINYHEMLRAMITVIVKEYNEDDEYHTIDFEEDKDRYVSNIDEDWRNE